MVHELNDPSFKLQTSFKHSLIKTNQYVIRNIYFSCRKCNFVSYCLRVAMLKYTLVGWLVALEKTVNRDNSKTVITSKIGLEKNGVLQ